MSLLKKDTNKETTDLEHNMSKLPYGTIIHNTKDIIFNLILKHCVSLINFVIV